MVNTAYKLTSISVSKQGFVIVSLFSKKNQRGHKFFVKIFFKSVKYFIPLMENLFQRGTQYCSFIQIARNHYNKFHISFTFGENGEEKHCISVLNCLLDF